MGFVRFREKESDDDDSEIKKFDNDKVIRVKCG